MTKKPNGQITKNRISDFAENFNGQLVHCHFLFMQIFYPNPHNNDDNQYVNLDDEIIVHWLDIKIRCNKAYLLGSSKKFQKWLKDPSITEITLKKFDKLSLISYQRLVLLLSGIVLVIYDSNFNDYQEFASKLQFPELQMFLDENVNKNELHDGFDLLVEVEDAFNNIQENETLLNDLFLSLYVEFENIFTNLLFNISLRNYTNTGIIAKFIKNTIVPNSIFYTFYQELLQKKCSLNNEYAKITLLPSSFDVLGIYGEAIRVHDLSEVFENHGKFLDFTPRIIFQFLKNDDVDALQRIEDDDYIYEKVVFCFNSFNENIISMSCFDVAAFYGSVKCFKYLLINFPVHFNVNIINAILGQNIEIIRLCIQNGVDLHADYPIELEAAILTRNLELFIWVSESSKYQNHSLIHDEKLGLYLSYLIKTQNYSIFNYLINLIDDENPEIFNEKFKMQMFYQICYENNDILLEWYLKKFNGVSKQIFADTFCAAFNFKPDLLFIQKLLNLNINKYISYGAIPLHYACRIKNLELVKRLLPMNPQMLNIPEFLHLENLYGNLTPLMIAIVDGNVELAEFLLNQKRIDVYVMGTSTIFPSTNAIHLACYYGQYQILNLMMPFFTLSEDLIHTYWYKPFPALKSTSIVEIAKKSQNENVINMIKQLLEQFTAQKEKNKKLKKR
ncbi:hypothetical protein TRFO_13226 [Tritrichomonas foetus]|uniref:Uncharacterized protein n=1 Tax=Tritrichomonas foetus TaxID=1144522 RepID=A0A1J4KYQ4_9EUKA|nr:hypothetical protein TRFO_13226 [Tritrichomonas foetus]|eukprot:OHT16377.1 hypothetical protein TRFO_13226 [Tritrichomonas foetus]